MHGKHVLIEKPFALTVAEAQRVAALAAERGRVAMVSQHYRFYPAARVAASLLREGALGPVDAVTVDFHHNASAWLPPEHRYFSSYQPLITDMAIHHFDLMRMVLAQDAREVFCRAWNPGGSRFADPAAAAAIITFEGGTVVTYRGSWHSHGPRTPWAGEWRMACAGEKSSGRAVVWRGVPRATG